MNFNEKNKLLYFCKFINIMYMYTYIFSITLGSNHAAEGKAGASSYLHNPTPRRYQLQRNRSSFTKHCEGQGA